MRIDGDTVVFSTGRRVYANCGIIGLNPDLKVSEGYDGLFNDGDGLIAEERKELAAYMIEQWKKFAGSRET